MTRAMLYLSMSATREKLGEEIASGVGTASGMFEGANWLFLDPSWLSTPMCGENTYFG